MNIEILRKSPTWSLKIMIKALSQPISSFLNTDEDNELKIILSIKKLGMMNIRRIWIQRLLLSYSIQQDLELGILQN